MKFINGLRVYRNIEDFLKSEHYVVGSEFTKWSFIACKMAWMWKEGTVKLGPVQRKAMTIGVYNRKREESVTCSIKNSSVIFYLFARVVYTNKCVAWATKNFVRYRRKNYRTDPNETFHVQSPTIQGCTAEVS